MISIKEYRKAASLEEAWELNQKKANRIIGGMMWLKMSHGRVQTAIDLSGLGLDAIEERDDAFVIGSMVTLRQLETHPGLDAYTDGAVKEALKHIVGVQFRNSATVGGSLFGRYGFSDVLTIFMTLDAEVELYKGGVIPVSFFSEMSYDRDVLVRVIVKKKPEKYYYQSVRNTDTDFPALTCGAALTADGSLRLCFGARPQKAMMLVDRDGVLTGLCAGANANTAAERAECGAGAESEERHVGDKTERHVGARSEDAAMKRAGEIGAYAAENIPTGSNMRGSASYRSRLVKTLAARAAQHFLTEAL